MFIIIGFAGFLPKYMEIEYQISKATASMIAGKLILSNGSYDKINYQYAEEKPIQFLIMKSSTEEFSFGYSFVNSLLTSRPVIRLLNVIIAK